MGALCALVSSTRTLIPTLMPAADSPASITHALTLKGASLTWAIQQGIKVIENRSVQLPLGWSEWHREGFEP